MFSNNEAKELSSPFSSASCDGAASVLTPSLGPLDSWMRLCLQLDPVLSGASPDPEALFETSKLFACWADAQAKPRQQSEPEPPEKPPSLSESHGDFSTLADVGAWHSFSSFEQCSELSQPFNGQLQAANDPWSSLAGDAGGAGGGWSDVDQQGNLECKADGKGPKTPSDAQPQGQAVIAAEPEEEEEIKEEAAEDKDKDKETQTDEEVSLKVGDEKALREPQKRTLGSRSSTEESRSAIREAKQRLPELQKQVTQAAANTEQAKNTPVVAKGTSKRSQKRAEKNKSSLVNDAQRELTKAQNQLENAERNLSKTKRQNRDPLGEAEKEHTSKEKQEKRFVANKDRWAKQKIAKAKQMIAKYERMAKEDPKNAEAHRRTAENYKEREARARSYQRESTTKKVKDAIQKHGTISGRLFSDTKKLGEKYAYNDHGVKAFGGEASRSYEATIGNDGINMQAKVEGKLTLIEYQKEWKWQFPHHLLGEEMATTFCVSVRGFLGAEASAQIEANLGKMRPTKPEIDRNAIMAGVDAFAGAKLQLGVGAAYEWQKKDLQVYRPRIQAGARMLQDLVGLVCGPLGYIIAQLVPTNATEKVLSWLLEGSAGAGLVPLLSLLAKGEASLGAGVSAKGAIGLRNGSLVVQAKANATWGLGIGAEVELALDLREGPLFILLNPELPELWNMMSSYVRDKINKLIAQGLHLGAELYDWFTSDDRARELVAHRGHEVLALPDRVTLINKMISGFCGDDDEQAILIVLRDAQHRGDMSTLVASVGRDRLVSAIDGEEYQQLRQLIGD